MLDTDSDDAGEIILLDTGLEEIPADSEIPMEELEFASTLVTTLLPDRLTQEVVSSWWQELTGAPARISLLTADIEAMSANERERVEALGGSGWSVNTSFVAYKRGSEEAQREAIEFIRESVLNQP